MFRLLLLLFAFEAWTAPKVPPLSMVAEWHQAGAMKISCPIGLVFDSQGRLLVLDQTTKPAIHIFEPNGVFVESLSLAGSELPGGMALGALDNIYVTDLSRDIVLKFSLKGAFLLPGHLKSLAIKQSATQQKVDE